MLYCFWNTVVFRKTFYRGSFSNIYHRTSYSGVVKPVSFPMWTWPYLGRSQAWSCRMRKWNKERGEHPLSGEGVTKGRCWSWECLACYTSATSLSRSGVIALSWACWAGLIIQWTRLIADNDHASLCFLQLHNELEKGEKESAELQEFANAILQQIADHCPDILEQVVNALEESSWPWPLASPGKHTSGQAQSVQGAMRVGEECKRQKME